MNVMGEVISGKVIPAAYGSISHLHGSKMINDNDKLIGDDIGYWMTEWRKDSVEDRVIITEKVDGMNASVLKMDEKLYPLMRKGYDVRTSHISWIRGFGKWVDDNQDRFYNLLKDGERACGEWLLKTHTIQYDMHKEPFMLFDIISDTSRDCYDSMVRRAYAYHFNTPGLVHVGEAMPPETAIAIMGTGYNNAVDGKPEGVVYRYEHSGIFIASAKFVSNQNVGNLELFEKHINDPELVNFSSSKMKYMYMQYAI